MTLFDQESAWKNALSSISAFEIPSRLVFEAPQADTTKILEFLRRHKIDLVIGISPLSGGPQQCGHHVEGYSAVGAPLAVAQRIRAVGGNPQYFTMDEPLYFGHVFDRQGERVGCMSSVGDIAKDVAGKVRQIWSVFPQAKIGDVEPITAFKQKTWMNDLEQWFHEFQIATGQKLAFFRLDIGWRGSWQDRIDPLAQLLRREGIPLQVIYNGDSKDRTGDAWISSAVERYKLFESVAGFVPDAAVIQFWTENPSRFLPESDSRTATFLIDQYTKWKSARNHSRQ